MTLDADSIRGYAIVYTDCPEYPEVAEFIILSQRVRIINTSAYMDANITRVVFPYEEPP